MDELDETVQRSHAPRVDRQSRSRRVWPRAAATVALGLAMSCGDSTDTTAGAGGSAGTTGGGGSAAATLDSGIPRDRNGRPAAQASVSLHLTDIEIGAAMCVPGRQWVNAPSTPTQLQSQQTSSNEIGPRAVDGADGNSVACAVRNSGGGTFTFSGDTTTRRTDGTTALHPTVLHFEANAIAPSGPPATGVVTLMNENTDGNFVGDACSFSVTSSGSLGIDTGKIWASVTCELLADPTSSGDGCRLDVGFLVFENCAE
jgi:hypothetical protein